MLRRADSPLVPPWARAAALVGLALFLTVWAWWPMFASYPGTSIEDGHYFHQMIAISKAAVWKYHELPLWNAFDCRGIPMWDHRGYDRGLRSSTGTGTGRRGRASARFGPSAGAS